MPRVKKTSSGSPAQPVQAIVGQEYGRGIEQERMQRAMPAPREEARYEMPANSQPQMVQSEQPQQQEQTAREPDFAQLRDALSGIGGVLNRPDDRPNISAVDAISDPMSQLRAGVMPPANRTGEMMRELSRRTGDPTFANLAARAGF